MAVNDGHQHRARAVAAAERVDARTGVQQHLRGVGVALARGEEQRRQPALAADQLRVRTGTADARDAGRAAAAATAAARASGTSAAAATAAPAAAPRRGCAAVAAARPAGAAAARPAPIAARYASSSGLGRRRLQADDFGRRVHVRLRAISTRIASVAFLRRGEHQRGLAARRLADVDVGAVREQRLDGVRLARRAREHQRRRRRSRSRPSDWRRRRSALRSTGACPIWLAISSGV